MSYEVRCPCGVARPVTTGDAGSSFVCTCSRTVNVPPLHELRAAAGENGLSPVMKLRAMQLKGELPDTRTCVVCGRSPAGWVHIAVECERAIIKSGASNSEKAAGCLLMGIVGWLMVSRLSGRPERQYGEDVVLTLPVRACEACRAELNTPAALKAALRHIPEYAELLDRYPNARVAQRG